IRFLDVWKWTGVDWSLLANYDVITNTGTQGFPASSIGQQAVYDPLRKRIVMQGGNGHSTATTNVTYLYGTLYGGSPTNWTSEFDCLTDSWTLYSRGTTAVGTAFGNSDGVIGRISRSFNGFVPATGKVYKICGQNAAATGSRPTLNVYEYQATPIAKADAYGTGCTGPGGTLSLTSGLPWTTRQFVMQANNLGPLSFGLAIVSFGQVLPGVFPLTNLTGILPGPGLGCDLLIGSLDITGFTAPFPGASQSFSLTFPDISVDPTLPGVDFYVQILDLDFSAGWIGTYATNGLACEIGAI
ncbi:MAG: hypothetical protein JNK78_16875, partial [Planctomycetes bacterium]|nr:hypothetical protein [Planctomycetota bacterium]